MEWKHPPKQNGVRAAKSLSLDITDLWTMFLTWVENPIVHPMAMPRLDALGPSSPHPTDITSQICPIHSNSNCFFPTPGSVLSSLVYFYNFLTGRLDCQGAL